MGAVGSETGGTAQESELFYKEESELLLKGVFLPQQVCSRFVTGERQFLLLCRDYSFGNYLGHTRAKTGLKPSLMTWDCINIALSAHKWCSWSNVLSLRFLVFAHGGLLGLSCPFYVAYCETS